MANLYFPIKYAAMLIIKTFDNAKKYDFSEDDVQKVVSLCVDGKESRIIFIDHKHVEMSVSKIKV